VANLEPFERGQWDPKIETQRYEVWGALGEEASELLAASYGGAL